MFKSPRRNGYTWGLGISFLGTLIIRLSRIWLATRRTWLLNMAIVSWSRLTMTIVSNAPRTLMGNRVSRLYLRPRKYALNARRKSISSSVHGTGSRFLDNQLTSWSQRSTNRWFSRDFSAYRTLEFRNSLSYEIPLQGCSNLSFHSGQRG